MILPVLFNCLQYLQQMLLQKEKPLSFVAVPWFLGLCVVFVFVGVVIPDWVEGFVRNLSIVSWFVATTGLGVAGKVGSGSGSTRVGFGSTRLSSGNLGMLVLMRMSLMFLGRLYPVMTFFVNVGSV